MRWPWLRRRRQTDLTVVSWSGQVLAYVQARGMADGRFSIQHIGVERQGSDSPQVFVQRLQAIGLRAREVRVMLRPEQYQFLQIDAPPVAPDELRAAARFQVRDLVHAHIDDITLDVLKVGDATHKGTQSLFVVAAANLAIQEITQLANALQWTLPVIDVQETAQRNLQTALAERTHSVERANAALVIADENQALFTVSAREELFYARRLELPPGFMTLDWSSHSTGDAAQDGFLPVEEYVPEHAAAHSDVAAASSSTGAHPAKRLVVEVQRSLDVWDRTWSQMPLSGLQVDAGARSAELAQWLGQETGQTVGVMDLDALFDGLQEVNAQVRAYCQPLLGIVLRD